MATHSERCADPGEHPSSLFLLFLLLFFLFLLLRRCTIRSTHKACVTLFACRWRRRRHGTTNRRMARRQIRFATRACGDRFCLRLRTRNRYTVRRACFRSTHPAAEVGAALSVSASPPKTFERKTLHFDNRGLVEILLMGL